MSKKDITVSAEEFAAMQQYWAAQKKQKQQHRQQQNQQQQPEQQQQPAKKPAQKGVDGLTVTLIVIIALMWTWGAIV